MPMDRRSRRRERRDLAVPQSQVKPGATADEDAKEAARTGIPGWARDTGCRHQSNSVGKGASAKKAAWTVLRPGTRRVDWVGAIAKLIAAQHLR